MDTTTSGATPSIAYQLRQRRAASRRCEPLADGRHDPLDRPRRSRTIQWRAVGAHSVEFVGCDRAVAAACTFLGVRYMRARFGGAWLVHHAGADDVAALLESRGYRLEVTL